MSEWYAIKNKDDVEISDDKKEVEINFDVNNAGNCYVTVPIRFLEEVMGVSQLRAEIETWKTAERLALNTVANLQKELDELKLRDAAFTKYYQTLAKQRR